MDPKQASDLPQSDGESQRAPDRFQTTCLEAERLTLAHLPDLERMHADPQVMATLGGVRTSEWTRDYLTQNLAHWERHGYGLWVFRDRRSGATAGQFAGQGGLRHMVIGGGDEIELAYSLLQPWWGLGLASEMAAALLRIGFGTLGLPDLVCFTLPDNHASRRVMEKQGFQYEREVEHAGLPHVLYRLRTAVCFHSEEA